MTTPLLGELSLENVQSIEHSLQGLLLFIVLRVIRNMHGNSTPFNYWSRRAPISMHETRTERPRCI